LIVANDTGIHSSVLPLSYDVGNHYFHCGHLCVADGSVYSLQLILEEQAIQAACGPQSRVLVQAEQDDLSLEYCEDPNADSDCVLTIDGRPVRHVRVDCRISVFDKE
jgi:hypothetical protein